MATSPVLTSEQSKAFLTKDDLMKLEGLITEKRLQAMIEEGRSPHIVVRGKYVPLFVVLELIGTL